MMAMQAMPEGWEFEDRTRWISSLGFVPDTFQHEAFDGIDDGAHVVVSAPTGTGKTLIAEYAIIRILAMGRRAFYTTPIKALSNQKFRDLCSQYGDDRVGLLTGDHSIRADADIVVMTTEVLRNMLYAQSAQLRSLGVVILDEVHYLQDRYRGAVWEEVIIHLDTEVRLVCLSATVSNAEELGSWIEAVRGPTTVIREYRRPVPLEVSLLASDRATHRELAVRLLEGSRVSTEATERFAGQQRRGRYRPPGRVPTVALLQRRQLLPVLYFIFSRQQCDEAAESCLRAGLMLTTAEQRVLIRQLIAERLSEYDRSELEILGIDGFTKRLEAGIAAHHAGLIPAFKEIIETCFIRGLIQIVFATETLALGVNLPARSVVIERLTRFRGETHEMLTAGEFTQLTGRAGRRGIDVHGDAFVHWSPYVRVEEIADLARSRDFILRSAFRPTYNMAAHLVESFDPSQARHVLSLSFAQFQSDRSVVKLRARLENRRQRHAELIERATSPFGDIGDYVSRYGTRIDDALRNLRPGMVIAVDSGKFHCPAVVVNTAQRRRGTRLTVITPNGSSLRLAATDFEVAPAPLDRVELPANPDIDQRSVRQAIARELRLLNLGRIPRQRAERHPVEADPDLGSRLSAMAKAEKIGSEIEDLERRLDTIGGLAAEFERVVDLLASRGFVDREDWRLLERGILLTGIFHEDDLLIAEALDRGLLDGLNAAELAALASMFVYEHRSPDDPPKPWYPSDLVATRADSIMQLSTTLRAEEEQHRLPIHRHPDPGFIASAYGWVSGEDLASAVDEETVTAGDFVRVMKQVVDLCRQIGKVAPVTETANAARDAGLAAWRDVVADSLFGPPASSEQRQGHDHPAR